MNYLMAVEKDEYPFLRLFQQEVATWVSANFDASIKHHPLLGVQEEVGELAHAFLKSEQGIRGDAEAHRAAMIDAVGDIVVYLSDFCSRNGIDFHDAVTGTWDKVSSRDWKKNARTGT